MISFQNVSKIYGPHSIAVDKVNLNIAPKEFISIVGRSGAGKTTLIRLLTGEEQPTKGRIFFHKQEVQRMTPGEISQLRRRIGVVYQDFKLLAKKTIFENVAFALEVSGTGDDQIKTEVPQVLELVGIKDKISNFPAELSGGERQRASLARALINRPEVIVADEPTGNLDPIHTWDIIKLLLKINSLGTTIVLATHNKEIVNALGKRVVTMDKGKIIRDEERGKYVL